MKKITEVKASGKIGDAATTIDEETFKNAVRIICPQLFLKPETPSRSKEENILVEKLIYGMHSFDDEKCVRCGISKSHDFDKAYFNKYSKIVLDMWVHKKPPSNVRCQSQVKISSPRPFEIAKNVNVDLLRKFEKKYGWRVVVTNSSVSSVVEEMAYIISALGYYLLGEKLLKDPSKELRATVWNYFMEWGMNQKEDAVKRILWSLRELTSEG